MDSPLVLARDVAFATASDYVTASLGPRASELPITVEAGEVAVASSSLSIEPGASHTAFVTSGAEGEEGLAVALFADLAEPPGDEMLARFFNAVLGWDDIDVCLPPASADEEPETVFVGVAYGGLAAEGYVELARDTRRLQFRAASDDGYCMGRVIAAVEMRAPRGFELALQ